jgi:ABC-type amino acid transport system permease subunit
VLGTAFDPSAPNVFGRAILEVVEGVVTLIQVFTLFVGVLDQNKGALIDLGRAGVLALGAILSAVGSAG